MLSRNNHQPRPRQGIYKGPLPQAACTVKATMLKQNLQKPQLAMLI